MPEPSSLCPIAAHVDRPPAPPTPDTLAYSFTLPAAPRSPAIARSATRTILRAHGLDDVMDAAVQVVGELVACSCRLAPSAEVYVSLRYRDDALRVVLYDAHPRHTHPRLLAACDARRRAALRVLACVVKACAGEWGFGDAREPGGGTRMWAVLPRSGARAYAAGGPRGSRS
ncbi:ATP-binding protein [Streptomyces sp. NPDC005774]|uniref:ATP-binding protein n=1 Tax=Streptomyces sp. NPDC005774 TaxID=3364728 RepID=UPI0036B1B209